MEKGDISGFGHLACPLAGGDMGRHRGCRIRRQIDWANRIWGVKGIGGRFEGGVEIVFLRNYEDFRKAN